MKSVLENKFRQKGKKKKSSEEKRRGVETEIKSRPWKLGKISSSFRKGRLRI